jgi:2-hydroxychromene-2-carboxylate isomerase
VTRSLDFYFDYTCPFAYIASTQVARLAQRTGVDLRHRPVLLGGIFKAQGTAQNLSETLGPAKSAHNLADMTRWAKRYGVPLVMPPVHPKRSVEALRATLATEIDPAVVAGFYRAYWVEGVEISSRAVVARVVTEAGHDAARVLAAIETDAIKEDLKKRTDAAVARGVFGVPTFDDGAELFWGQDRMRFAFGLAEPRAEKRSERRRTLDVYFDFSSPFSYLASTQIPALVERTGARVSWHPIVLGGLFKTIGQVEAPILTFSEAKQKYYLADLKRWATHWGVPFAWPTAFPTRSLDALRVYLALPEGRRDAFRDAVFRAYWAEDKDITKHDVLASCGADADAFAKMTSDEVKSGLRASTERAARAGVFGVPTFVVDGRDLYWGQDRLDLVEEALTAS